MKKFINISITVMVGCAILAFLVILKPEAFASIGELSEASLPVFKLESLFTFLVTMVGAIVTIVSIFLTINFEEKRTRKRDVRDTSIARKEKRNERRPLLLMDVNKIDSIENFPSEGEQIKYHKTYYLHAMDTEHQDSEIKTYFDSLVEETFLINLNNYGKGLIIRPELIYIPSSNSRKSSHIEHLEAILKPDDSIDFLLSLKYDKSISKDFELVVEFSDEYDDKYAFTMKFLENASEMIYNGDKIIRPTYLDKGTYSTLHSEYLDEMFPSYRRKEYFGSFENSDMHNKINEILYPLFRETFEGERAVGGGGHYEYAGEVDGFPKFEITSEVSFPGETIRVKQTIKYDYTLDKVSLIDSSLILEGFTPFAKISKYIKFRLMNVILKRKLIKVNE